MARDFSFGWPKINSVFSLALCGLLPSVVTPPTPVKSCDFCEMLSSVHPSVEAKECSPAPWVSFSLSYQNQSLRFFWLFVCPISTSSESELYSEELSSSETVRQSSCIKFTKKLFFTQNFMMHHFWKFYGNKLAFIIYIKLEQKCNWSTMWRITTVVSCIMNLWSILSFNNFPLWC